MKLAIALVAAPAAMCEMFGTWTVWQNYRLTSTAAALIEAEISKVVAREDAVRASPEAHLREFVTSFDAVQQHSRDVFTWSAIATSVSPLLPSKKTEWGLRAFVVGAILGYVAVLLAVCTN